MMWLKVHPLQNTNEDQKDLKQCNQGEDNSKCECCCFYSECNDKSCAYNDDCK